jgi:sigma-B regulation protein RsbU (phosphoserine phosphatase)
MTNEVGSAAFPLDMDNLLSVLNLLNAGVYITDKNRRIILWNNQAEKITGYKAQEVVGKACHEEVLCHIDKNGQRLCASELCPLYRSIYTGVASQEAILLYAHKKDGSKVAVSVSVAPLRNDRGIIVGGIEIFRDETRSVADLEFATRIQQSILPQSLPMEADVEFDVRYFPHDQVGGDFYSVRKLDSGRYGILVADVSGHGVSAALYTMWLKSAEENLQSIAETPGSFATALNKELCRYVMAGSFVTLFYGVLDLRTQKMVYVNAGHPPPIHLQASTGKQSPDKAHATGPPMGIEGEFVYDKKVLKLNPGDFLLCYTDGITEVFEHQKKMLGINGLETLLVNEFSKPDGNLLDRLYRSVLNKSNKISLSDDVLLLSIRLRRLSNSII